MWGILKITVAYSHKLPFVFFENPNRRIHNKITLTITFKPFFEILFTSKQWLEITITIRYADHPDRIRKILFDSIAKKETWVIL